MLKMIVIAASVFLVLHGLIHLLGTTVYLKLATLNEFAYKTTVLGGRVDLGENGIRIFGVLWAVAAAGFVAAAIASIAGWNWGMPVLLVVTLFSLVLTALDWNVAYAGAVINIIILAVVAIGPRVLSLIHP